MARALLNTTLEFGLVSVPIAVMPMESKQEVELDRGLPVFNDKDEVVDYHALNTIEVDALTRVPRGETVPLHGVFTEKPDKKEKSTWTGFKPIAPEAMEAIDENTKIDTFLIDGFIPKSDIPFERARGSYYLAPKQGMAKQLRLLYEALKATDRAGILKIVIRKRQHAAVVYAQNGGIFLSVLAWGEDYAQAKEAAEVLATADADPKMVSMAMTLIEAMEVSRDDLDALKDDLRLEKENLLNAALNGEAITVTAKSGPVETAGDLMAKLEASLAAAAPKAKGSSKKAKAVTTAA